MEDVTGFNQKNQVNDGERLVNSGLAKLKQRYSDHIIEIIRLMLKFDEAERPSFVELAKLVLTSTENSLDSPKGANNGPAGASMGKRMSQAKGMGTGAAAAAAKSTSIELQNKKVSKTFSMQNFNERNGEGNDEGGAHGSAADGSMEKGHVGRRVLDSSKSEMISHPQEETH